MPTSPTIITRLRQSISKLTGSRSSFPLARPDSKLGVGIAEIDARINGGLATNDLHEFRCSLSRDIASTFGFLLALMARFDSQKPIVWITDPACMVDVNVLFPDGLAQFGLDASRLFYIRPMHLSHALWSAGEAAISSGVAAVVFQVRGNPGMFDLPTSRKLALRTHTSGKPFFVLRQTGEEEASSAATRWHVAPRQSLPNEDFRQGVGHMRLVLTLEKNRNGQSGQWVIAWNPRTRSFENAAQSPASANAELPFYSSANRPDNPQTMGKILAPQWGGRQAS